MKTYICTATFDDPRIHPRNAVITTAGTRSDARKAGRKEIEQAIAGKGWTIAMVTATAQAANAKPAGKVVAVAKAKSTRTRKPADPVNQQCSLVADAVAEPGTAAWWTVWHATKADIKAGVVIESVGGRRLALVSAV